MNKNSGKESLNIIKIKLLQRLISKLKQLRSEPQVSLM